MRQGRHSRRTAADWDTQPSRSAELAAAVAAEERDPEKRAPGRKDRKNYCKPNRGAHAPVMVMRPFLSRPVSCQWTLKWDCRDRCWVPEWRCWHQEECGACGKVFRLMLGEDCPNWHPVSAEERAALDAEIERRAQARQKWVSRRPAVAGPQGYRRPR